VEESEEDKHREAVDGFLEQAREQYRVALDELADPNKDLLDQLFPSDFQLPRETEHRQYGKERG